MDIVASPNNKIYGKVSKMPTIQIKCICCIVPQWDNFHYQSFVTLHDFQRGFSCHISSDEGGSSTFATDAPEGSFFISNKSMCNIQNVYYEINVKKLHKTVKTCWWRSTIPLQKITYLIQCLQ